MQSNYSEFINVTGVAKTEVQKVTSGDLLIYRGVSYVRQQPQTQTKRMADAQLLPANTKLHYRGATYTIEAAIDSSVSQALPVANSWLIYRGVAYQVHRVA